MMLAMRSSSSPHIYAVGEPTGFQNRIGPLLTFFFIFFLAPSPDSYTSSPGLPDNTARPHIKRNFFHPHPRLGREDCSESRHIFFSLRTPILSGPPPATAMSDSGDESEAKEPAAMGVQGTDTKDPYSNAIGDHVRALYESCFCYHYPRSPVYVKLQQPIQEIEDIHIDLVFPKDFKTLRWYFSKSTDKDHEWNAMELKNFGDGIIACFSNNFKGEEDKYSWHNSDVGNAVPVFKQGMEHFVRLHYDKKTSELVTSVNGREYNRHEMPEGADANEFTLYGDVYVTDLIVPYKSLATPLKVDLIGAVLYDDKYSIIFDTTHNSKMVTLSFGDMRLEVDLEKEKEHLQDRRNDLEVTSYSNCAFLTLNRKILEQVSRRLVTDHMLITGDIKIHKIEISKG